ncbi:MAG: helix-hairpin-helix domain-containing protein [bacterium]|nr:helix-hairpin-helix domain-containing protein [bacterium]
MKANKWKMWITAVLVLLAAGGYGMHRLNQQAEIVGRVVFVTEQEAAEEGRKETFSEPFLSIEEPSDTSGNRESEAAETVFVYVCGQVKQAGVYELAAGSRIVHAVEAAGGFLETAAKEYWNLAAFVEDGMKIAIPTVEEVAEHPYGLPETEAKTVSEAVLSDGRIRLNLADAELLQTLPGIGEAKAADIVAYREEHGGFTSIEEIMEISGIKEAVFEKIKEKITVD